MQREYATFRLIREFRVQPGAIGQQGLSAKHKSERSPIKEIQRDDPIVEEDGRAGGCAEQEVKVHDQVRQGAVKAHQSHHYVGRRSEEHRIKPSGPHV